MHGKFAGSSSDASKILASRQQKETFPAAAVWQQDVGKFAAGRKMEDLRKAAGFSGSYKPVAKWLQEWRGVHPGADSERFQLLTTRDRMPTKGAIYDDRSEPRETEMQRDKASKRSVSDVQRALDELERQGKIVRGSDGRYRAAEFVETGKALRDPQRH